MTVSCSRSTLEASRHSGVGKLREEVGSLTYCVHIERVKDTGRVGGTKGKIPVTQRPLTLSLALGRAMLPGKMMASAHAVVLTL